MIKTHSFLCKSFRSVFSDFSDMQMLENSYASLQKAIYSCPCCGQKGMFSDASSYSRSLITVVNDQRTEFTIKIRRLRCSCGHCHAVIPDFLIPYGSYTIRFVLHVLKAYLHRASTVAAFCDYWQISVSTLYDWIHRFRDHWNLLSGVMKQIHWVSDQALFTTINAIDFAATFSRYCVAFSFLQNHVPLSHPLPSESQSP